MNMKYNQLIHFNVIIDEATSKVVTITTAQIVFNVFFLILKCTHLKLRKPWEASGEFFVLMIFYVWSKCFSLLCLWLERFFFTQARTWKKEKKSPKNVFPSRQIFCFTQFHAFFFLLWFHKWKLWLSEKTHEISFSSGKCSIIHSFTDVKKNRKMWQTLQKIFFLEILFYFSLLLFHSGSLMILFFLNFFLSGFTHEKTFSH